MSAFLSEDSFFLRKSTSSDLISSIISFISELCSASSLIFLSWSSLSFMRFSFLVVFSSRCERPFVAVLQWGILRLTWYISRISKYGSNLSDMEIASAFFLSNFFCLCSIHIVIYSWNFSGCREFPMQSSWKEHTHIGKPDSWWWPLFPFIWQVIPSISFLDKEGKKVLNPQAINMGNLLHHHLRVVKHLNIRIY